MWRSTQLEMDCDNGLDLLSNEGILDIIPPTEYDPFEAKFCASLFWLVFHATEDGGLEDVPSQVTSPIQRHNGKGGFVIHPEIVQFLTKGEVYCTVCARIFPGKVILAGHWSVIQTLSRNGIYVVDGSTDVAITDSSLEQTNPFHQGAHLALMDALMTAYSSQVVSIQSVVQAVRRFSTFSASRELPFDLEDALLLWVNKLSTAVNAKHVKPTPSNGRKLLRNRDQEKKIELRKADKPEETSCTVLPVIDDLLKGMCDGRCLLGILLFYEPTVIQIEDIFSAPHDVTTDDVTTDDSIRNLDLFRSLCSQYFCTSVLALKVEDILYGAPSLKINLVALLAEMFWKCEGNSKQSDDIRRSKTSCSDNGRSEVNGYDGNARSRSAPMTRNAQFQEKEILLKIQNFVENGSFDEDGDPGQKPVVGETRVTNAVSSAGAGNTIVVPEEGTVEVQGVVVKLRKKVPRNVQPGGGHEALLSRRMKKSLCSRSQEDLSSCDTSPRGAEEQFDAKSDELNHQGEAKKTVHLLNEPQKAAFNPMDNVDVENLDLKSPKDDPSITFDLDLDTEAVASIDLLSPISETTEPGSLGNSSNGSVTSPRDFHSPIDNNDSVLLHQNRGNSETGYELFVPPLSQTPRRVNSVNQSSLDEPSVPRGSYVISNGADTVESAVAAGLPVVERESLRKSGILRGSSGTLDRSSDAIQFRSSHTGLQSENASNKIGLSKMPIGSSLEGFYEPTVEDEQRSISGDHWSGRRYDDRYSTFSKNKSNDEEDPLGAPQNSPRAKTDTRAGSDAIVQELISAKSDKTNAKNDKTSAKNDKTSAKNDKTSAKNDKTSAKNDKTSAKNDKSSSDPPITWFVHRKNDTNSREENVPTGKPESPTRVSQHATLECSGGKTTSWVIAAEGEQISEPGKKGSGQSANKSDSLVSRDLNLLRLKLAEKQRRIEAQKQRTKEQQEEERKRFGENVFWFAVGKDRERKDSNGINSPNETRVQKKIEPPPSSISEKTLDSSDVEPSTNEKFATFTKQSSLDELPPSMGKLQDRTYSLPTVSKGLTTDTSELLLPNQVTRNPETFVMPAMQSLSNRNLSEEVVHEFRLSRQTSGSQDLLLNKVQTTAKPEALGNSGDLPTHSGDFPTHSGRVPVMNYKSIISVPLTYTAQPVSPNFADGSGNSANLAHAPVGVADGFSNQASSPTRKCWDVESTSNDEPEMAVSKSNYYMFENGNVDGGRTDNSKNGGDSSGNGQDARWTSNGGTTDIGKQRQESPGNHQDTRWANEGATDNSENRHGMSRNCREERQGTSGNHHDARWTNGGTTDNRQGTIGSDQDTRWINQQVYKGGQNIDLRKDAPNEISERLDDQNEFKKAPSSEKMSIDENSGTFERHPESPRSFEEINGNSPVSENDNDTPKKGLSLFIGDQNAVGEDGLTPEQLKKREKFLKNRQMKIEEEKLKRGAIMEKKRRKEEKMKEIQFRREKEELSRHERLQEKKQQAENAKQERQKYELQRKENLQGRTMMDGVPGGYTGFSRTEMIPHGHSVVGGGMISAGMNNGSSFTSPSSAFSGFTGVQSYVRPSGKTNRKLTINAISHVCLPGAVNKETKDKCLQAMTESSAQHFLILFREGLKFRGLYSLDPESNQVLKVHGVGPRSITEKMIQRLYKYNSGGKEFSEIPTKSFSISVDGFTLQKSCWQSHKPSVSSKTVSNYKVSPYRTR